MKKLLYLVGLLVFASACSHKQPAKSYSWEEDLDHRIRVDFRLTEAQVKEYIRQYIPDVTDAQMRAWEESNALEYRIIDGEKRYFRNAGPNLFRVDSACYNIKLEKEGFEMSDKDQVNQTHVPEVIAAVKKEKNPRVEPRRMRVTYTLTVDTNAVPAGEVVCCWLPYPRTDHPRQTDVKLIRTSQPDYQIAPDSYLHKTLYMEQVARQGQPTRFSETFEFTLYAEWHDLKPEDILKGKHTFASHPVSVNWQSVCPKERVTRCCWHSVISAGSDRSIPGHRPLSILPLKTFRNMW